jgi:hypothetical protein
MKKIFLFMMLLFAVNYFYFCKSANNNISQKNKNQKEFNQDEFDKKLMEFDAFKKKCIQECLNIHRKGYILKMGERVNCDKEGMDYLGLARMHPKVTFDDACPKTNKEAIRQAQE